MSAGAAGETHKSPTVTASAPRNIEFIFFRDFPYLSWEISNLKTTMFGRFQNAFFPQKNVVTMGTTV